MGGSLSGFRSLLERSPRLYLNEGHLKGVPSKQASFRFDGSTKMIVLVELF